MSAFAVRHAHTGLFYAGTTPTLQITVWRRRPRDAALFATESEAWAAVAGLGAVLARAVKVVAVRARGPAPMDDLFERNAGAAATPTAGGRHGREARPAPRRVPPATTQARRSGSIRAAGQLFGGKDGKPAT